MAILPNNGDIILDVVLTTLGRQRLAQAGGLNITKYAVSDDGINYEQYNATTGSAYRDLEIMQSFVTEAQTMDGEPQYSLMSLARNDILYLPVMKTNELHPSRTVLAYNNKYMLSVNSETTVQLKKDINSDYILESGGATGLGIVIEDGLLDTSAIGVTAGPAAQATYLRSMDLYDGQMMLFADANYFGSLLVPGSGKFQNNPSTGAPTVNFMYMSATPSGPARHINGYLRWNVSALNNGMQYVGSGGTPLATYSVMSLGVPGTVLALGASVIGGMDATAGNPTPSQYSRYGTTSNAVFSSSRKYDYIDTYIYVQGVKSGTQIQLPIRIIRYVSG